MLPFKKILCPLDFSEPSYLALNDAIELAGHFSAELILIHALEPYPPATPDVGFGYYDFTEAAQAAESGTRDKLQALIEERVAPHIQTFPIIRRGTPAAEIVNAAREHGADIIVIATHGLTGWRHLVFGSVAEKVVQTAPCRVLTVHRPVDTLSSDSHAEQVKNGTQ